MNYIVYDLEATCWENPPPNSVQEIIEIGAYKINHFGEVRGKFSRFVRPQAHPTLSPFCRQLTGIEQLDVNKANYFPVVIEEFWDWGRIQEEEYMLCSWGNFDWKMLANDCRRHRLESDWTQHHANIKEQYRLMKRMSRSPGLRRAIEMEDLLFTGQQHRAISDAENLTKLFLKYLGSWSF